jgi:hypothetical protein
VALRAGDPSRRANPARPDRPKSRMTTFPSDAGVGTPTPHVKS